MIIGLIFEKSGSHLTNEHGPQQGLQQKLLQRLSPQQIQLMKCCRYHSRLEIRIKEEMEENPALELDETTWGHGWSKSEFTTPQKKMKKRMAARMSTRIDVRICIWRRWWGWRLQLRDDNYPKEQGRQLPFKTELVFTNADRSAGLLNLMKRNKTIAEQIVWSIDEDGYRAGKQPRSLMILHSVRI